MGTCALPMPPVILTADKRRRRDRAGRRAWKLRAQVSGTVCLCGWLFCLRWSHHQLRSCPRKSLSGKFTPFGAQRESSSVGQKSCSLVTRSAGISVTTSTFLEAISYLHLLLSRPSRQAPLWGGFIWNTASWGPPGIKTPLLRWQHQLHLDASEFKLSPTSGFTL